MEKLVTTTHLDMTHRSQFSPAREPAIAFQLVRVEMPCPELNRFLYATVGSEWWWYSRLGWDYSKWLTYLDRDELQTWVAYVRGTPAGYFELERQAAGNVEIKYFGLMPTFVGKGIGGAPSVRCHISRVGHGRRPSVGPHLHTRSSTSTTKLPSARISHLQSRRADRTAARSEVRTVAWREAKCLSRGVQSPRALSLSSFRRRPESSPHLRHRTLRPRAALRPSRLARPGYGSPRPTCNH